MNWFTYFSLVVILVSYLSSIRIFTLKPFEHTPAPPPGYHALFKYFSWFLLFTLLGECFGVAWPRALYQFTPFTRSNQWFYILFHFLSYVFYLWFFRQVLSSGTNRKITAVFLGVYITFSVVNYCFIQGPMELNTFSDLVACFMMVFLSIAYYYQLLHARVFLPLHTQPLFWITTGLLVYHLGSMMGLFLINVMNLISLDKAMDILVIIQTAAIVMYINYSIAFLCMKKK